jgi:hypothetical protein
MPWSAGHLSRANGLLASDGNKLEIIEAAVIHPSAELVRHFLRTLVPNGGPIGAQGAVRMYVTATLDPHLLVVKDLYPFKSFLVHLRPPVRLTEELLLLHHIPGLKLWNSPRKLLGR